MQNYAIGPCCCGSGTIFDHCCGPFLQGKAHAETPEQLMRSRYSAFVLKAHQYILNTQTKAVDPDVTLASLEASQQGVSWLNLEVRDSGITQTTSVGVSTPSVDEQQTGFVEFAATYQQGGRLYKLSEHSRFITQQGLWFYSEGKILPDSGRFKLSGNSPCVCGSGKKYKKCCALKTG